MAKTKAVAHPVPDIELDDEDLFDETEKEDDEEEEVVDQRALKASLTSVRLEQTELQRQMKILGENVVQFYTEQMSTNLQILQAMQQVQESMRAPAHYPGHAGAGLRSMAPGLIQDLTAGHSRSASPRIRSGGMRSMKLEAGGSLDQSSLDHGAIHKVDLTEKLAQELDSSAGLAIKVRINIDTHHLICHHDV